MKDIGKGEKRKFKFYATKILDQLQRKIVPQTTWLVYRNLNILWNYLEEEFLFIWNHDEILKYEEID